MSMSFQEIFDRILFLEKKYISHMNAEREAKKNVMETDFLKSEGRQIIYKVVFNICE